jgi:hypothetical protein
MSKATNHSTSKVEAYEAYRNGEITEIDAQEFFGDEWEDVRQLERVECILSDQPEQSTDSEDLFL